jgi:hypothetical protein
MLSSFVLSLVLVIVLGLSFRWNVRESMVPETGARPPTEDGRLLTPSGVRLEW